MKNLIDVVKRELKLESDSIMKTAENIDESIVKVIDLIYDCKGKVVVTGMGKTGIIARKVAATLASTGTTAIFLHAAEGIHGDLGMVSKDDLVLAISYSGNSPELISIIPFFKFIKVPLIALTGNMNSKLAKNSDIAIDCSIPEGYEPFGLVPTASTTVALAVGDAISVALLEKRNFQANDYARFHPGGTIGKKLLYKVEDLMHSGERNPIVRDNASMQEVILEMTSKSLGCTSIVDDSDKLVGIITDGDLRRILTVDNKILSHTARECMTKNPQTLRAETLAVDALNLMEEFSITMLPVIDNAGKPIAMLHMHDLIRAGVVG